jgi:hypothetical protein
MIGGIFFFGVPHDGMDIEALIPMVGDAPNRFLLESINRLNPQILKIQQTEFHNLGLDESREIICFYETLKSPTAKRVRRVDCSYLTCKLTDVESKRHMGNDGTLSASRN